MTFTVKYINIYVGGGGGTHTIFWTRRSSIFFGFVLLFGTWLNGFDALLITRWSDLRSLFKRIGTLRAVVASDNSNLRKIDTPATSIRCASRENIGAVSERQRVFSPLDEV